MLLNTSGILRPTPEDWRTMRQLTHEDRRRLGPGLPLRRFTNTFLGSAVVTRDGDVYATSPGWVETARRSAA